MIHTPFGSEILNLVSNRKLREGVRVESNGNGIQRLVDLLEYESNEVHEHTEKHRKLALLLMNIQLLTVVNRN